MYRRLLLGLAIFMSVASLGYAKTITVFGQDNVAVDRQAIQDAIDSAVPGDTVQLVGVFQLDGGRVLFNKNRLTIAGLESDNDGDGLVNEDWEDGADNDGDGMMDEDGWDTVVKGLDEDNDGIPDFDPDFSSGFNRGFGLRGIAGTYRNIAIRGIEFQTHYRAITISPDWDSTSTACADYFSTDGQVAGMTVERNRFENNNRGLQVIGAARDLEIRNNLFTNTGRPGSGTGIFVQGFGTGCLGGPGFFPVGRTENSRLIGNMSMFDNYWAAIFASRSVSIIDNLVQDTSFGIGLIANSRAVVRGNRFDRTLIAAILDLEDHCSFSLNEVRDMFFGVALSSPSPGSSVKNNRFENALLWAIDVDFGAEGFSMVNNEFEGSAVVDVYLFPDSFRNTVIATDFTTSVFDDGEENRLLGTLAMIHNPGVPDEVRAKLMAMRPELGNQ